MRIAFVTFEYPPFIIGGAGIYAENIARELAKLDHQVVVFTPQFIDEEEILTTKNLEINRIKIKRSLPFAANMDADVYVLSSLYEVFSINILEITACVAPPIVTDRCGLADIIEDHKAGLVVLPIKNEITGAPLYVLLNINAKKEFEIDKKMLVYNYNWNEIAKQMERVYRGIT